MKRIIAALLCFVLAMSAEGCGTKTAESVISEGIPADGTTVPVTEAVETENVIDDDIQTSDVHRDDREEHTAPPKETLKLQYRQVLSAEQTDPETEIVDIMYSDLPEIEGERYSENPGLRGFADYMESRFVFSYNGGLVNNDYGTVCFIDENGSAVQEMDENVSET